VNRVCQTGKTFSKSDALFGDTINTINTDRKSCDGEWESQAQATASHIRTLTHPPTLTNPPTDF
jgi:hypothetical protein